MKKLLIKAPAVSYDSALLQMHAGARELYAGLQPLPTDNAIFTARAPIAGTGKATHSVEDDFSRICAEAKRRGVTVDLVANAQLLPFDRDGGMRTKEQYVEYVKRGLALGANGVIVGDIGNLIMLRKAQVTAPVVASVHLSEMNSWNLKFLQDLGVTSAVLPHHMHIREIEKLAAATPVKLIAFASYGCSFIESTCALLHTTTGNAPMGWPCRARWCNAETGIESDYLNVAEDCAICLLDQLANAGVASMKIVGRELEPTFVAKITKAYVSAADLFARGAKKDFVMTSILRDYPWWKPTFCDPKKCRHLFSDHYI